MKKSAILFVIIALLFVATAGFAQVKAGSVDITPTIGMYVFENNEDMNRAWNFGLRAGYNFTKYIGAEGFFHYSPTNINLVSPEVKTNVFGYGIEGILNLMPDAKLMPFLAIGIGGMHYSDVLDRTTEGRNDKFAFDYGYGVKYFLTEHLALRMDIRHVLPFNDVHNNLLFTGGLTFSFGGTKKARVVEAALAPAPVQEPEPAPVAPVVVDSDKDGVPDDLDKCPDTPAGVAVDKDGCPVDSDKDGVPDYLDKCPNTPIGEKVDKDGCPPPVPVVQESKPQAEAAPVVMEKKRITLNVLFATNKSIIKKNSFKDIDDLAAVMKKNPDLNVTIEGHTDNVGSAVLNKKLSQSRAEAVKKYLENTGIDAKRLTAKGFGPDKPVVSNDTKEGRQKNRRVEAELEYVVKK